MAEAFRTNIVLSDKDAKIFVDTMVNSTPEEMLITPEELVRMRELAKKLNLGSF